MGSAARPPSAAGEDSRSAGERRAAEAPRGAEVGCGGARTGKAGAAAARIPAPRKTSSTMKYFLYFGKYHESLFKIASYYMI